MARKIPCHYCKLRRRKCERQLETEPCERCFRMKIECVPQDQHPKTDSSDDDDSGDDFEANLELMVMNQQIQHLNKELENLQVSLDEQKLVVRKNEPVWNIEFDGKQLLLKSEIKSLEELMLYGKSVIRYLSPFGHSFGNTALKFERINPSFVNTAMKLFARFEGTDKQSSAAVISRRFSSGLAQFVQPRAVMNRLIDNYFSCLNDSIPILYEAYYREHYRSLVDPMTDPITLALCASVSVSTCKHSFFNSHEKRYIGEFFYERAIASLTEIFDDPDRSLEALMACNLLQMFMLVTLRIDECKRWATVAALLASNLVTENPDCVYGDDSLPYLTRVKYSLIHRNSVLSQCVLGIIGFLSSGSRDPVPSKKVKFDILPDEPRQVQEMIEIFNYIFDLSLHPASIVIVTQARQMAAGKVGELNFEEIVRYEDTLLEWWHNLPDHLKICQEPFQCTPDLVQRTNSTQKLVMATYIWLLTLSVQGCLIQPKPKEDLETVYNIVRERAIYMATYAADIVLALAKKIDSLGTVCYSTSKLLIRSIDSLMTLIQHKDDETSNMARGKMREFMRELSKSISPDHQVSLSTSPFSVLSIAPPGSTPPLLELYKNYPLPGEALVFDIINTTVERTTDLRVYTSSLPTLQ